MKTSIQAVPDDYRSPIPHLVVKGAREAIAFYKKALGAEEIGCVPAPDGTSVMHAELKLGQGRIFLVDEFPQMGCKGPLSLGGSPITIHLYVEDVDAVFQRATTAGAEAQMPPQDMFWGDRYAKVRDPFGHEWSLATHKEDLTPEEIQQRAKAAFGQCGGSNEGGETQDRT